MLQLFLNMDIFLTIINVGKNGQIPTGPMITNKKIITMYFNSKL